MPSAGREAYAWQVGFIPADSAEGGRTRRTEGTKGSLRRTPPRLLVLIPTEGLTTSPRWGSGHDHRRPGPSRGLVLAFQKPATESAKPGTSVLSRAGKRNGWQANPCLGCRDRRRSPAVKVAEFQSQVKATVGSGADAMDGQTLKAIDVTSPEWRRTDRYQRSEPASQEGRWYVTNAGCRRLTCPR